MAPNESSEDVNDFLQRIRELGERRDKEDDERTKKLEEEILQGRKERQARRAERARSLALTDDSSTLNIARLSASSISPGSINPPEHLEPTPHTEPNASGVDLSEDTLNTRRGSVQEPMDAQPRELPTLSRSRAGTLSWQQRPPSRELGAMSPSASPTRSPTRASHLRHHSTASDDRPRSQYGFPRLSKDFAGFSRSPERGLASPTREKEERSESQAEPELAPQVPEVSEEPSAKLDKLEAVEERPSSPPRTGSRDSTFSHRFSVSSVSAGLGSPVHLSETQKLEPRQADSTVEEPAASPTQRRMSPERSRSTSPTKGMGGFVQSAMMRRSDSVSKRWSAQVPQGLSRSNSIISNRSSVAGPSLGEMGPPPLSRPRGDSSTLPPRPDSSHSDAHTETTERPTTPLTPGIGDREGLRGEGSPSRVFRPSHSRSASSVTADGNDAQPSPFVSKTMDPRRWSPSKATWLESALNRPELPRQPSKPPSQQPNWARDRQSRGSVDMGRVNSFKEVTPVGLMRTPPPGLLKKSGVSGPSLPTSPDKENPPESPIGFPLKKTSISGASVSGSPDGKHKDALPGSPLASPLKGPNFSGRSVAEDPEDKSTEAVPESPAEFPFRKPSLSGASVSGSPTTHPTGTTPASPSGSLFKKSVSSASGIGSPEAKSKEIASESPKALGNSAPEPAEDRPGSQSHIDDTLKALSGGEPTEEPSAVSHDEAEIKSLEAQEPLTPVGSELTPQPEATPTPRDPPKSLVSPKPNFSINTSSRGPISPTPKPAQSPVIDFRANLKKREVVKETEKEKDTDFRANLKKREVVKDNEKEKEPDFRANLKKREVVKDSEETKEPEFKNIFGRLKKTETRNYVAPDELKGNILRGKASLNETGGPKKTERVDEFRRSLVMRKDEMKAGGGSIRRNTAGEKDAPKPADAVPEAIAKRQNMTRTNSIKQNIADEPISPVKSVGSRASQDRKPFSPTSSFKDMGSSRTSQEQEPLSPFPADDGLDGPGWPLKPTNVTAPFAAEDLQPASPSPAVDLVDEKPEASHATSQDQVAPELSPARQDGPREVIEPTEPATDKEHSPEVAKASPVHEFPPKPIAEATASPVQAAKSKLAGRINPALAGLLSRGPPAPEGPKKDLPIASTQSSPAPSAPLEHTTKSRARGPKRRPPQATTLSQSAQDPTKEVGAISCFDVIPSQTPPSPVESFDDVSDRFSQNDDSVPDTEIPRPESPVAEHLPIEDPPVAQLPAEKLPVEQPSLPQSSAEETHIEQLPTEPSPVEQPRDERPSETLHAEEPVAKEPLVEEPPSPELLPSATYVEQRPFFEDFSAEDSVSDRLSFDAPSSPELFRGEKFADEHPSAAGFHFEEPIAERLSFDAPSSPELPRDEKFVDEEPVAATIHTEESIAKRLSIEVPSSPEPLHTEKSLDERPLSKDLHHEYPVAEQLSVERPSSQVISDEKHTDEMPSAETLHAEQSSPVAGKAPLAAFSFDLPPSDNIVPETHASEEYHPEEVISEQTPVREPSPEVLDEKSHDVRRLSDNFQVQETTTEKMLNESLDGKAPADESLHAENPVVNSSLVEQTSVKAPAFAEPTAEQPSLERLSLKEFSFNDTSAEKQPVDMPSAEDPSVEQVQTEKLPVEQPIEPLPVEHGLKERSSVESLRVEEPIAEQHTVQEPSVEQHLAGQTLKERSSIDSLREPIVEQLPVKEPSPEPIEVQKPVEQPSIEQHNDENVAPPVPLKSEPPRRFPSPLQPRSLTTDFNTFPSRPSEETRSGPASPGEPSPSSGPPVPSKSNSPSSLSPSTPKSRWIQQNRYASPSPSPLRTSYNENRRDSAATQHSTSATTIGSSREALSRPVSHVSPPVPPKDDEPTPQKPVDPRRLSRKMSAPSLVAQASEAKEVIAGFFKTFPNPQTRMDIDPQVPLMKSPDDTKIRTIKRHIWELTGDGRRQELPSHQEYILYQGSMYICVHVFEIGRSTTSEVYLWRGDDVPDTAVDSEQAFARKVARENSSKLQVIRQGKEPTRFIQALGGIMITRRGSSSRHNSSALYMLCGRKHLGQMTFDEVDYSLRNLCSGFPYVVSAPFGKLYLWKGKGSGPEETGAARLIGMDLGLTGEFEEVGEGEEPEDFFDVFAGPREAAPHMCQDYWRLKPKYSHFRTRLLRIDHELGQPTRFWNLRRPGSGSPVVRPNDCVQEIEPFCYRDIGDKDVYILDTFFEIYVIVGEQAIQKSADFASAVVFAHEYGILATSLQDRPFIPKSYVALGGVADRCQSAFRKWNPRNHHAPFVFPLDVVIESLRELGE
ncbi:unnamed protein product [Penicillium olsonii]|uniref:DUF4045 domain-containing protein n=1 Tax=Penicillium olsonii TaxID=99116 RepID=A0A9W4I0G6_PENOL|nr:unnamed protein product [Penicillium olsonii]CAG8208088.1 unnamed protein product [Penicillium olsonii]